MTEPMADIQERANRITDSLLRIHDLLNQAKPSWPPARKLSESWPIIKPGQRLRVMVRSHGCWDFAELHTWNGSVLVTDSVCTAWLASAVWITHWMPEPPKPTE